MRNLKPLVIILGAALAAGIALAAAGMLYTNFPDRYGLARVAETRSTAYDHAMLKLTELWSNENYLETSIPIVAHGDDRAYAWLESSAKAMAVSEAFVSSLKYIVGRRRPDGELDRNNSSFPSSHASSAFAFATTLAMHYPELGPKAFEMAFFVSISRVYLERHYISDIIGGAAIGTASALWSETYLSWLHFDRRILLDILLFASGTGQPAEIETPLFRTPAQDE
ncbi:MAG: phosphatase PAP2 family protein [bacterium]|jgi:hypothetical protein